MKKILKIILQTLIILSICNLFIFTTIEAKDVEIISETINFSNPELTIKDDFITIHINEETNFLQNYGKPKLPFVNKVYTFPAGTEIKDISVIFPEENKIRITKEIQTTYEPEPLQNPKYKSSRTLTNFESINDMYPSNKFDWYIGSGKEGKNHVIFLTVQCYPIRYNPSKNMIHFSEQADISIKIKKPSEEISFPDIYDLVIIAPEKYSDAIQSLVNHKNNHGLKTSIKTVEDILSSYTGRDSPEKIKYFLKDALDQWGISYVLLIGNVDDVPIRKTSISTWGDMDLITDHYYADIYGPYGFCSWDSNGNDIFGEFSWDDGPIDEIDLYSDINVGRLPCCNIKEVETVINKIISYETNTYGQDWFDNVLYLAGDTFPGHGVYEGEFVTNIISQQMDNFNSIKLWTSTGNYNPLSINREINKGVGFISYSGHGYEQGFGTSPPNEEQRIEYYTPFLIGLKNSNKLPVVFFDACSTSKIDFRISDLEDWLPGNYILINFLSKIGIDTSQYFPCFAWFITKMKNGGAIATIGATRVAFTGVSESGVHSGAGYLNVHFYEGYFPGVTISQMFQNAQNEYINNVGKDCLTIEEFILIGDPSLKVGGYQ